MEKMDSGSKEPNVPKEARKSVQKPSDRLKELEAVWAEKFIEHPKLPSSALLTGATAMAAGFGAIMFFAFAWVTNFRLNYSIGLAVFASVSLGLGLVNRLLARRWYEEVREWSSQREVVAEEMKALRGNVEDL